MKEKVLQHPLIRWAVNLRISRWAASNPLLSRFCTYEVISYLICGVLTTLVDYVTYFVCKAIGISTGISTTVAWILAVLFAYFVNKVFVFLSTDWSIEGLRRELIPFFSCRIFSYVVNLVLMILTVDLFCWNEPLMKIGCNVIVLIINYFGSKLLVFRSAKSNSHAKGDSHEN
ncbi:MAG: GtrA family protein [Lachnospiraceae bacterium]|nr:GtrA family protein [Lachnospiraceae bacterium]